MAERAFGHRAADLENSVVGIDDGGEIAPGGDVVHRRNEIAAGREPAHIVRQRFENGLAGDAVFLGGELDHDAGVLGDLALEFGEFCSVEHGGPLEVLLKKGSLAEVPLAGNIT